MRNVNVVTLLTWLLPLGLVAGCAVPGVAPAPPGGAVGQASGLPVAPPWPRPFNQRELVLAAGLSADSEKMLDYHIHTQLDVFYEGRPVEVPADVGIGPGFISPLHTHDTTGKLHVEAAKAMRITLGQFFTQWGVPLVGAKVYENGILVTDGMDLELLDRRRVVVVYGKPPAVIPADPPNW